VLQALHHRLSELLIPSTAAVDSLLNDFSSIPAPTAEFLQEQEAVADVFGSLSIEDLRQRLSRHPHQSWVSTTTKMLNKASPTSLAVTLEQMRRASRLSLRACFEMEYYPHAQFLFVYLHRISFHSCSPMFSAMPLRVDSCESRCFAMQRSDYFPHLCSISSQCAGKCPIFSKEYDRYWLTRTTNLCGRRLRLLPTLPHISPPCTQTMVTLIYSNCCGDNFLLFLFGITGA